MIKNLARAPGLLGALAATLSGCLTNVGELPESSEGNVQQTRQAMVPPCNRWKAPAINPCWGIVAQDKCWQDPSNWSDGQRHNYNKWLYSSTSKEACDKFARKYGPTINKNLLPAGSIEYPIPAPGGGTTLRAACTVTNYDTGTPIVDVVGITVDLESVTPEPCCFRTPKSTNRYAGLAPSPSTPQSGGDFTKSMKLAIKAKNQADFGTTGNVVTSDLGPLDYASTMNWYKPPYLASLQPVPANDDPDFDPSEPEPTLFYTPYNSNVDHIIPRIDTHGCSCGENSPANALVITSRLNQQMSNRCNHPDRVTILENYTVP